MDWRLKHTFRLKAKRSWSAAVSSSFFSNFTSFWKDLCYIKEKNIQALKIKLPVISKFFLLEKAEHTNYFPISANDRVKHFSLSIRLWLFIEETLSFSSLSVLEIQPFSMVFYTVKTLELRYGVISNSI